MTKSINFFSVVLLKVFNFISRSGCNSFWGEPDFPEKLLK